MTVTNMTLVKVAAVGGILTVSMGIALRSKINNNIKQTSYYKQALKLLRTNQSAVYLLGEPIRDCNIDIDLKNNFTNDSVAQYQVPVKGAKQHGTLHFWARKDDEEWTINRMELELKKEPNRRLLIK